MRVKRQKIENFELYDPLLGAPTRPFHNKLEFFMPRRTTWVRQIQNILKLSNWCIGLAATVNLVMVVQNL